MIDERKLPPAFPTHRHSAEFWEQLGRAIATYGFLEEVLGKAIFAFTGTRTYAPEEIATAYEAWVATLERALIDPLWNLAESYGKSVREHPDSTITNIDELVADIKEAASLRNVLCHGSWHGPNVDGASVPFFVNRRKEIFDSAIDAEYLRRIQSHVAELSCAVINTVTHMGFQFPGGAGPGKSIWVAP